MLFLCFISKKLRTNLYRVNSTAAFDKQYMEGRYGADPYLTNMLSGGDGRETEVHQS